MTSVKPPFHSYAIFLVLLVMVGLWLTPPAREAKALSNPLKSGLNLPAPGSRLFATPTPTRVPANGNQCNVTFVNLTAAPLYTGYGRALSNGSMADGGVTDNNGIPVCSDTTVCIGTWATRDTTPGALWYKTAASAPFDGGFDIRIELGTGCENP